MAYPCFTSSPAQRSGAPLERGPRPLQSCMITTAGNGPGPSGFSSLTGIRSGAPEGPVVVMDRLEVVPTQPPRKTKASSSGISFVYIVTPHEEPIGPPDQFFYCKRKSNPRATRRGGAGGRRKISRKASEMNHFSLILSMTLGGIITFPINQKAAVLKNPLTISNVYFKCQLKVTKETQR
jgi:hypothetical protein